jgi:hypothetical protein
MDYSQRIAGVIASVVRATPITDARRWFWAGHTTEGYAETPPAHEWFG